MSSYLKGLTKREALAFKAGGWASIPADYVIENYGIPYAKKHLGPKSFYKHINKMGRSPRRRYLTAATVSQDPMEGVVISHKRAGTDLYRATKRAKYARKAAGAGSQETKTAFDDIAVSTQSVGVLRNITLFDINQGTSNGDRLGSKIYAKYIDVRGYIRNLNTSTTNNARLLIVQDNKPQLGNLTSNLFAPRSDSNDPSDYTTGGDLTQITDPINHNRFRVLSDKKLKMAPLVSSNEGKSQVLLDYRVKVDRYIEYLTDTELDLANKIKPIFYAMIFCELENGSVGSAVMSRHIQFYMHFCG